MGIFKYDAEDIDFNPSGTLLVSKNVQAAIKEMYAGGGSKPFATPLVDPALNSITTAMVDDNGGVRITLTTTGNNQILPAPTDTTKMIQFMVVNNDTSTHPITIIGTASVVLQAGEKMLWLWDGTAWIGLKDDTLWIDDGTTYQMKVARDLDLQNKGLKDTEVTTAVLLGDALNTSFDTTNKSIIGALNEHFGLTPKYRGVWNATTNTPALVASIGNEGDFYIVSVAGTTSLDGIAVWDVNDWIIFYGGVWQRIDNLKLFSDDGTDVKLLTPRNIDMQDQNINNVDDIKFNLSRAGILAEGELGWNDDDKTLEIGLAGSSVALQIGQEILIRAKAIGSNIDDGKAVYISGATGAVIEASLVSASDYSNACKTIAISTQDVLQNGFGYFTTFGLVRGIDTNSFTEGDILWLGENGNLVNVEPTLPNCPVRVGYCLRKSATVGVIFVNIEQKESLTEREATKESTGFVEPQNVTVSYDNVTRKITLGGTNLTALWRSVPISAIVAGEIDLALPAGITTTHFLQWSETSGFEWTNTFDVSNLYIASAVSDGTDVIYCLRECHGLLQHPAHDIVHFNIGTFRTSGGDSTGVVLNSTTATERRPIISDVYVKDEDLPSIIPGVSSGSYTRFRLDGAGETLTYDFNQTEIVELSGNQPYYNQFTGGAWQKTLLPNNHYMAVYALAKPTTSDAFSNKYRIELVTGQSANANLGVIQAETTASLNLGVLRKGSPEYVFIHRYIVQFIGGNWRVVEEDKIEGSRSNQVVISGITGLSAVAVNANNLQGNGTIVSPLSMVEVSNTFGIETKTLDTFLKADGKMVIYEYILDDGTNFRHGVISASWDGTSIGFSDEFVDTIGTIAVDAIVLSLDIDTDNIRLRVVSSVAGFSFSAYRRIK